MTIDEKLDKILTLLEQVLPKAQLREERFCKDHINAPKGLFVGKVYNEDGYCHFGSCHKKTVAAEVNT